MRLANCFRTTGDIFDKWPDLVKKGFGQQRWAPYCGPGHWPDADMLVVGKLGWGEVRENKLTSDEQIAHMSFWVLLSSPLMVGCDVSRLDDFTLKLLCNDEVLAINQDALGAYPSCAKDTTGNSAVPQTGWRVYTKKLADQGLAVGLFNFGDQPETITISLEELGINGARPVRNVWANKDIDEGREQGTISMGVAPHGAQLVKIA
jgi:alpha-galactosidase